MLSSGVSAERKAMFDLPDRNHLVGFILWAGQALDAKPHLPAKR